MGFEVWGRLGMDGSGWTSGLNKANREAGTFRKDIESGFASTAGAIKGQLAAAFGFGALASKAHALTEYAGKMVDFSEATGTSIEKLQQWDYAFSQNGATIEQGVNALKKLAEVRGQALSGNDKALGAFAAVGIDETTLKAEKLEATFERVAEAFRTTDYGAGQLDLISDLLGRAGADLLPTFRAGLAALGEDAKKMGLVLQDDVAKKLDEMGDQFGVLGKKFMLGLSGPIIWLGEKLNEMWDLLDIIIGGLGAAAGGFMGTEGSIGEKMTGAGDALRAHFDQVMENREKRLAGSAGAGPLNNAGYTSKSGDSAKGGDSRSGNSDYDRAEQIREQTAEVERRTAMRSMSKAEKLEYIQAEREKLYQKQMEAYYEDLPQSDQEKLKLKQAQLADEQAGLFSEKDKTSQFDRPAADALGKLGIFAAATPAFTEASKQVDTEQTKHTSLLEQIRDNTKPGGGSGGNFMMGGPVT